MRLRPKILERFSFWGNSHSGPDYVAGPWGEMIQIAVAVT